VRHGSPQAQISYDRFHLVAKARAAMDTVRHREMRKGTAGVHRALGAPGVKGSTKTLRQLTWGIRRDHGGWSGAQLSDMRQLQHNALKSGPV
jgi:transposase